MTEGMKHDVRVLLTGHGQGKVYLDGVQLPGVIRVQVDSAPDEANTVVVTMRLLSPRMLIDTDPSNADMLGTG